MNKHSRRSFFKVAALGVGACTVPFESRAAVSKLKMPNIVFIMADDMGYGDVGCYNPESKIPTPAIDALAARGMRFTDAHAPAAVCVPTRYGLLTGRYPFRMGGDYGGSLIKPDTLTLGKLLQDKGYATACVGKWHLGIGGNNPDFSKPLKGGPLERGFDYYFGIPRSLDQPPYYFIENDRAVEAPTDQVGDSNSEGVSPIQGAFWRKGGIAPSFRHVDVLPTLTRKAVECVDKHAAADKKQPFFLYLALPAPHTPWMPTEEFRGKSKAGEFGDFVVQVDDTVRRVIDALDRHGFTDNTLVFFTSDNGPVWYQADVDNYDHQCVGQLRGMKGDAWEGGHRLPFMASWPGEIQAGSESSEIICHTDMLATFAAITRTKLPADAGADSYNILPALKGQKLKKPIREATLLQSSRKFFAIRQGPWKLIDRLGSGGFSQPRSEEPQPGGPQGQLYNLDEDISEQNNVWTENPEVVSRLTQLLEKYKTGSRTAPRGKAK